MPTDADVKDAENNIEGTEPGTFISPHSLSFAAAITQKSLDHFHSIRVSISFYGLEHFLFDR